MKSTFQALVDEWREEAKSDWAMGVQSKIFKACANDLQRRLNDYKECLIEYVHNIKGL